MASEMIWRTIGIAALRRSRASLALFWMVSILYTKAPGTVSTSGSTLRGTDNDTVNGSELYGGDGNDLLTGGTSGLYADPGPGNDTINGSAGLRNGVFNQISYQNYAGANGLVGSSAQVSRRY